MITIFTDGSSRGNPGPGGWGAIVVSDGASDTHKTVAELGGREAQTTNNRMELKAAIEAVKHLISALGPRFSEKITINTDSSYVINGITKWVHGWKKKDWKTLDKKAVANRDLWEELDAAVSGKHISWNYVGGHVGIVGNERCDEIATSFADNNPVPLFSGAISGYQFAHILDISAADVASEKKTAKKSSKSRSSAAAYSYVSMVDGTIVTDATWKACEARVKGKRGARYKKALNKFEEAEIMAEFRKL